MDNIETLKSELSRLPLCEREELLSTLEQSIAAEHRALANEAESDNLAVCQERLERHERGQTKATPFGTALHQAFRGL